MRNYQEHIRQSREAELPLVETLVRQALQHVRDYGDTGLIQTSWAIDVDGYEYEVTLRRVRPTPPAPPR